MIKGIGFLTDIVQGKEEQDIQFEEPISMFFKEPEEKPKIMYLPTEIFVVKARNGRTLVFDEYKRRPDGIVIVRGNYDKEDLLKLMTHMGYSQVNPPDLSGEDVYAKLGPVSLHRYLIYGLNKIRTSRNPTEH